VPQRSSCTKEWTTFLKTNCIGCDTQMRTHEQSQRDVVVSPVLPDDDDNIINESELHNLVSQLAGSSWQDKHISKLFNSSDVENTWLSVWIEKSKVAEFDYSELSKLVNKTNKHPLENHQILYMQSKVMYLQWAYQYALEDMPNDVNWQQCCEHSIEFLCQFGIDNFKQSKIGMFTSNMKECFLIQIIMLNWKRKYNPNCFPLFQMPKMNSNNGPTRSWSNSTVTMQPTSFAPLLSQNIINSMNLRSMSHSCPSKNSFSF